MNLHSTLRALALALVMVSSLAANADIKDLLNGLAGKKNTTEETSTTETTTEQPKESLLDKALSLGNQLGIIPSKAVDANYLNGTWQYVAPAVAFKSDNFLAKAGGVAAAEKVKSEIEPYYQRFGLTSSVLTCNPDSTFTLKAGKLSLAGDFSANSDGETLTFNFKVLNKVPVGKMTTYVNAISSTQMEITFDMTQFLNLLRKASAVAGQVSGKSSISAISSLLDNYDGLTIGFKMKKTAEGDTATTAK